MIPIVFFLFIYANLTFHFKIRPLLFFPLLKLNAFIKKKKEIHKVAHSWLSVFVTAIVISWADLKAVQLQMYNYLPAVKAGGMLR